MVILLDNHFSYYNATSDSYVVPARHAGLLKASYFLTLYYGTLVGATFIVGIAFIVLSTKRQRKKATFFLHGSAFLLLIISSILVLQSTKNLRYAFFSVGDTQAFKVKAFRYFVASLMIKKIGCLFAESTLLIKIDCCLGSTSHKKSSRRTFQLSLSALLVLRAILLPILGYAVVKGNSELAWIVSVVEYLLQIAFSVPVTAFFFRKAVSIYRRTGVYDYSKPARVARLMAKTILFTFLIPLIFQIACLVRLFETIKTFDVYPIQDLACINVFSTIHIALLCTTWSPIRCRGHKERQALSERPADHVASPNIVTSFFGVRGVGGGMEAAIGKVIEAPSSITLDSSRHECHCHSQTSLHEAAEPAPPSLTS